MLVIVTAQLTCFWVRYYTPLLPPAVPPTYPFILFLGLTLLIACLMLGVTGACHLPRRFRLYTTSATLLRVMTGHIALTTLTIFLLRLGMQYTKRPFLYSRPVVVTGWILMFAFLLVWRLALGYLQRTFFRLGRGMYRAAVVGTGRRARELAAALQEQHCLGYDVLGLIGAPTNGHPTPTVLGEITDLPDIVKQFEVETIWLTSPTGHLPKILSMIFDPALSVQWAVARDDFEHFLQSLSASSLPTSPLSWDRDDLKAELVRRVTHSLEPRAKPRITFVGSRGIPATYGGIERYVEELSTRLASRGYRISVYCRSHYTGRRSRYRGVELRCAPCVNTKHLEAISHTLLSTVHLLFLEDEIVHYLALGPSLLTWLPRLLGHKTVVTVQGLDWKREKWGPVARTVLKIGELASAHLPHRTIVVSKSLKQYYQERHGKVTTYIPNGANRGQRRPARGIRELGLKEGSYVLTVGRLVPEKDYHTLIQAFRQVKTDKQLVITGGPSHTEEYVASLHEMAGNTPVIFTGYIHGRALEELYSNAYLFMSASRMEGLPIALLEAMSFGTCPLVSDIPPHVEALDGLGYVFRTGDTGDLTTKLQTLLDHPQKVMDTRDKLRQRVADVYNWDLVTDATEKVYQELLL